MRMHPDDRDKVVDFCVAQSKAGIDHEADYRALTSDGGYVWLRDVVHVVRERAARWRRWSASCSTSASARGPRRSCSALQRELEGSVVQGWPDRAWATAASFDALCSTEWGAAQRTEQPLSLVMIDIDFFKSVQRSLRPCPRRRVPEADRARLPSAAVRPRDFLARFGGEEFVLVLPNTGAEAARQVAERCRDRISAEEIAHERSPFRQTVTASFGVGTMIPSDLRDPVAFVNLVDAQLYHAKDNGRDRIAAVNRVG